MEKNASASLEWLSRPTLYPGRATFLRRCDAVCQALGVASVIGHHGLGAKNLAVVWEALVIACMTVITLGITLRFRWSLARPSFARRHVWTVGAAVAWTLGVAASLSLGSLIHGPTETWAETAWRWVTVISETVIAVYGLSGGVKGLRKAASGGMNPAFLLVGSFVLLIGAGTLLLLLPVCTVSGERTSFLTALFTTTSACCVTGLVVVDTGTHWTRTGQVVIMLLIQVGGLGIMTFGAFFTAIAGRNANLMEAATLRELLGSDGLSDVRRVVFAILGFTFGAELLGAVLLMPLWSDLPLAERMYQGLFHSVSAFCNAGFALTANSFVGMAHLWPVWGVVTSLIILGGTGFVALSNLLRALRTGLQARLRMFRVMGNIRRERLTLTTRLVVSVTFWLLMAGTVAILLLEWGPSRMTVADAWFQSVTFRTAGFNTVELGLWQPSTKLVAILLMVIGASPGSTGGGVKTSVFGVAVVSMMSVLRGRDRVEIWGRTIPAIIVNRALTILLVYMLTMMAATLLIVIFENRPAAFLEHLFEVASAIGTVGVTSLVKQPDGVLIATTKSLSAASQYVIIATMFLGRVGPLTLLLALAGDQGGARYEYPPERVTLG